MKPVEFLQRFHPDRAWVLTSIAADRKGIETKAFTDPKMAEEWIQKWDTKRNLYFSVGEVITPENKKAERENIESVHWLHVDIDAGPGDLVAELDRIKALVTTKLPEGVPKPTCLIFSGGGYQAFWKLAEPIVVHGNLEACEQVARYNKQLEIRFGGDQCSNVDRIMRLPGTLNIPNARKVAKGRVPVQAKVVGFTRTKHELATFDQAQDVALPSGSTDDVEVSGNVARLNSIDDLDEWKVPDRVKVICVQGYDPDEPKEGDNSRSAWLFDAVCNMARCGVPNDTIYSVITDPDFKIADSVLESANPHKYALKQLKSAKEHVISEWLRTLNDKFAVIGNLGGKCRVVEEVFDESLKRTRMVKYTFEDFRNRYMNQHETVQSGDKVRLVPVGKWWLEHPKRRQYDRLVFAPGQDIDGAYNLWRGFGFNAIPSSAHESFLDHLLTIICGGYQEYYDYLIGWMAQAVQRPDLPGMTAFVMRGRPGTGKSFFAKHFGQLFGRHFLHVSNAAHLVGNFNSHLRDSIVVFGDEAFYAGDKKHESVLKTLITEETLIIEAKGVDAEACPNYTHLILASNSAWVVPVGAADRRFFIVDVSESRERDTKYFGGLARDLENGGYEALLHYLLHYDLSVFNVQDVPETDALTEQKTMTMEPHEEWWMQCLQECRLGTEVWHTQPMANEILWLSYVEHCATVSSYKMVNRYVLGHFLSRVCPDGYPKSGRKRIDGVQARSRQFPPVQLCRASWDIFNKTHIKWDDPTDDAGDADLPF